VINANDSNLRFISASDHWMTVELESLLSKEPGQLTVSAWLL